MLLCLGVCSVQSYFTGSKMMLRFLNSDFPKSNTIYVKNSNYKHLKNQVSWNPVDMLI